MPYFTANTNMLCREGPSTSHVDRWQLSAGEAVQVLSQEGMIFPFYSEDFVASYLTREIEVDGQVYSFRRIKDPLLTNAVGVEHKRESSSATKKRAFLDTLYLNEDYHFDNLSVLDWSNVFEMLPLYNNRRMSKKVIKPYKQVTDKDKQHEIGYLLSKEIK